MTKPEVRVGRTLEALMKAAADECVRCTTEATRASGRCAVSLAGGSTPAGLYDLLASEAYARRIEWTLLHVFWGDERCLPPGNPGSNYRMAREHLLARVPLPERNVHRILGEKDPIEAAAAYERELRAFFATPEGPPRSTFDLTLLGMGAEGHTASLFPGTAAVHETEHWVVALHVAAVGMWRITLTPIVLNAAGEVMFLVAGRDKAATLHRVLEGSRHPDVLPAQAVVPRAGPARWFVDAAATAELKKR